MSTLVLGTFDGVHLGHQALIKRAEAFAGSVIACTFSRPPAAFFKKDVKLLTTPEEKTMLLKKYGADEIFMQPFDEKKAAVPAEEYIGWLCRRFRPQTIIAGFDHTFGQKAEGNCLLLKQLGQKYGYQTEIVPPVLDSRQRVISSTGIRSALCAGDAETAALLLGRGYSVSGPTVHGRHIGQSIGFPTVNTSVSEEKLIPGRGVYATVCRLEGRLYKGMTNIGINPTVTSEQTLSVETHILGFRGDVYGKKITISFLKKIRDEKKFSSLEELTHQLSEDALLIDAYIRTLR